jgi:hypothetical protein
MLAEDWVRDALRLRGPQPVLPVLWRRFLPADRPEILGFARSRDVTLVINLRKEAASRDANYFEFRQLARDHGITCWDLHELDGDDLSIPIGLQAARVLERHDVPGGTDSPAWLRHFYRPRPAVVGICVGASVKVKRWSARDWSSLISALHAEGRAIEVAAGPDTAERDIARQLAGEHPGRVAVTFPSTPAALRDWIARLGLLVSNDTLAVHLAAALGCPTVGIYLATEGLIWSPVAMAGRFVGVQSSFARWCTLMKVDGTCQRFYRECPAPCRDIDPRAVRIAVASLDDPAAGVGVLPEHGASLIGSSWPRVRLAAGQRMPAPPAPGVMLGPPAPGAP